VLMVRGQAMYFQAMTVPNLDAHGAPSGFYAMAYDITARKNSELRQRESEERLRTITNNLPVLISYIDRDTRYSFANAVYQQWYGVAPGDMVGRTVREVFGSSFSAQRAPYFQRCLLGETVQMDLDIVLAGESRVIRSVLIPHVREDRVIGAYVLSDDVTAVRRQEIALRELANTDALTGLPNRRSYEVQLSAAVNRATRSKAPMALMFLDIDRFKEINDTMGHASGDEVLREFARRLCACVRKTDTVSRLAGDEFTIIIEAIGSIAECEFIGHKLVAAMAAPFKLGGDYRDVSASIGIAWCAEQAPVARLLALDADAALYIAKAAGGNQFALRR
jgi:diguanylate cyclase (GGDEF)-like protein/PAS domain S-box-containing protein